MKAEIIRKIMELFAEMTEEERQVMIEQAIDIVEQGEGKK